MKPGSIICRMVIDMNEDKLRTVAQLRAFLGGTLEVRFEPLGEDAQRYAFVAKVVRRLRAPAYICPIVAKGTQGSFSSTIQPHSAASWFPPYPSY